MKTIEERARAHANENYPEMPLFGGWADDGWDEGYNAAGRGIAEKSFIVGAESQRTELTRWNDPKEVLPEVDKMVLVKRKSDAPLPYDLAQYDGSCWIDSWCGLMIDIIGWREIPE